MVKVEINNTQGLVQSAGSGAVLTSDVTLDGNATVNGTGVSSMVYGDAKEMVVAQGNYDTALAVPANAVILDVGYVCTEQIDSDSSTTLTFSAGLASSYTDFITGTQVNQTNADIAAGIVQSSMSTNIPHTSGAAIPIFLPAVVRYATTARTLNVRFTVGGADLNSASGAIRAFIEYIIVK
jgi:hypothetical protein|tara:strand:- start:2736 stop:3278 length:543 start_codon:yes stop_codon:yes gene_type:complete